MSDANALELLLTLNLGALAFIYRRLRKKASPAPVDLLSRFNHDLRSPLTGIIGFAELLERQPLTDKQKMYNERIHECSLEMMSLLRDVTELSTLESKNPPPRGTQFALHQTVQGAIKEQKSLARQKGVNLTQQVDRELQAWTDPGSLKRNLSRLLENAIKCSPGGDEVSIVAQPQGAGVCLIISYLGPGLSPPECESLFQTFSLESGVGDHKGPLTKGLSLYLVKRVAAQQHLRVWAESEGTAGRGARFHLWIPSTEPAS